MITEEGMDYWDPSRTTIMKDKGDLERGYKVELYMGVIGTFNFLNMHQI